MWTFSSMQRSVYSCGKSRPCTASVYKAGWALQSIRVMWEEHILTHAENRTLVDQPSVLIHVCRKQITHDVTQPAADTAFWWMIYEAQPTDFIGLEPWCPKKGHLRLKTRIGYPRYRPGFKMVNRSASQTQLVMLWLWLNKVCPKKITASLCVTLSVTALNLDSHLGNTWLVQKSVSLKLPALAHSWHSKACILTE